MQADHNEALRGEGIKVNQFQPRASLPQRTVQGLRDEGRCWTPA
jgi:chromosome partitioning protein